MISLLTPHILVFFNITKRDRATSSDAALPCYRCVVLLLRYSLKTLEDREDKCS